MAQRGEQAGSLHQDRASVRDCVRVVRAFLESEVEEARRVVVAKVAQIDAEAGTWEAEADVYVPNPTIRSLALPVRKEVLECECYLLRLDRQLNVVAYGRSDVVCM